MAFDLGSSDLFKVGPVQLRLNTPRQVTFQYLGKRFDQDTFVYNKQTTYTVNGIKFFQGYIYPRKSASSGEVLSYTCKDKLIWFGKTYTTYVYDSYNKQLKKGVTDANPGKNLTNQTISQILTAELSSFVSLDLLSCDLVPISAIEPRGMTLKAFLENVLSHDPRLKYWFDQDDNLVVRNIVDVYDSAPMIEVGDNAIDNIDVGSDTTNNFRSVSVITLGDLYETEASQDFSPTSDTASWSGMSPNFDPDDPTDPLFFRSYDLDNEAVLIKLLSPYELDDNPAYTWRARTTIQAFRYQTDLQDSPYSWETDSAGEVLYWVPIGNPKMVSGSKTVEFNTTSAYPWDYYPDPNIQSSIVKWTVIPFKIQYTYKNDWIVTDSRSAEWNGEKKFYIDDVFKYTDINSVLIADPTLIINDFIDAWLDFGMTVPISGNATVALDTIAEDYQLGMKVELTGVEDETLWNNLRILGIDYDLESKKVKLQFGTFSPLIKIVLPEFPQGQSVEESESGSSFGNSGSSSDDRLESGGDIGAAFYAE